MIPAKFDYKPASSAEEAILLLQEYGDEAKVIAGGHSLLPLMKLRLANPEVIIDIGEIQDLSFIEERDDHIAVGALTRHRLVEHSDLLRENVPLLAHAASHVCLVWPAALETHKFVTVELLEVHCVMGILPLIYQQFF